MFIYFYITELGIPNLGGVVGGSATTRLYSLHELIIVAVCVLPPKYYEKLSASSLQVQTIG